MGDAAREPATAFLAGGSTAVLLGWRDSTIDIDLKLVPDSDALLRAVPRLKEELEVNVELASPDLFIPVPPGWEGRSPWETAQGLLTVRHFDLTAQALAKLERGHARDLDDVRALLDRGLVGREKLMSFLGAVEDELYRFPAIDPRRCTGPWKPSLVRPDMPSQTPSRAVSDQRLHAVISGGRSHR